MFSTSLCEAEFARVGLKFWIGNFRILGHFVVRTFFKQQTLKLDISLDGHIIKTGYFIDRTFFFTEVGNFKDRTFHRQETL